MVLLRPRHLVVLIAGLNAPAFAQQSSTDGAIQQVEVKGANAASAGMIDRFALHDKDHASLAASAH